MCVGVQEVASKGRIVDDVVAALRNEEAAKLAAQHHAQTARARVHQLEVCPAALPCPACLLCHDNVNMPTQEVLHNTPAISPLFLLNAQKNGWQTPGMAAQLCWWLCMLNMLMPWCAKYAHAL